MTGGENAPLPLPHYVIPYTLSIELVSVKKNIYPKLLIPPYYYFYICAIGDTNNVKKWLFCNLNRDL
jgi:hypothetical protein